MSNKEAVKRWRESAERNLETARDMVRLKHRDWALFIGQLALEKLAKGLVEKKTGDTPPFIHDLVKLSTFAGLSLSKAQTEELVEITKFHIQARYEEFKYQLYKAATPSYTEKWMGKIEEYALWFTKHY